MVKAVILTQGKQSTIGWRCSIPNFPGNEDWRENGKFFVSPIYGGVKLLLATAAFATPPGRPNLGSPPLFLPHDVRGMRACVSAHHHFTRNGVAYEKKFSGILEKKRFACFQSQSTCVNKRDLRQRLSFELPHCGEDTTTRVKAIQ